MRYKACRNPTCDQKLPLDSRRQFCSKNCRGRFYRMEGKQPSVKRAKVYFRHCENCQQNFSTNRYWKRFCCTSCRVNHFQKLKRLEEKESQNA